MNVVVWRWGEVTAVELATAAEVNTQTHMPLPKPSLATLTLLLSLTASPNNPPLETSALTSSLMALTPKKHRSPQSQLLSSPGTLSPAVLPAGLWEGGGRG